MHSLETGIIVSIAAFFFLTFLTFTFVRETSISKEINEKIKKEASEYSETGARKYAPEIINHITDIVIEGGKKYDRNDEE